jgi:hypothetical protein
VSSPTASPPVRVANVTRVEPSAAHLAEPEAQRAALDFRVRGGVAVACGAARHVLEAVGQQHEQLRFDQRHGAGRDGGRMLEPGRRLRRREREPRIARRCGALGQHEVGRAERAGAQIHERGRRAAGAAHARAAGERLELLGQRDRVELHHVRARRQAFEVVFAFVVRDGVAAVLEVDADARHALPLRRGRVAGAGYDAAEQQRGAHEQLLAQQHGRARGIRLGAAVGARGDAIDERAAGRAGRNDADVAQRDPAPRFEQR